jgi:cellobiose phosphorylase
MAGGRGKGARRKRLQKASAPARSASSAPSEQTLSNGSYSVTLTAAGAGWSHRGTLGMTRWRQDPTRENWGSWIYLRDVASGALWSAGYQPTTRQPESYETCFSDDAAEIARSDEGIDTLTEIIVSSEDDAELRRVSLTNKSTETREIEVTSYAEIVLNRPDDDRAHPAFFNLFVETWLEGPALLCKRRPRDFTESPIFAVHVMAVDGNRVGAPQHETDRARFLGRGRTPRTPVVMEGDTPLSGTTGPVLDPIVSWRQRLRIGAGETARVVFTTAYAETREVALALADKYREAAAFERLHAVAGKKIAHSQVLPLRQPLHPPGEKLSSQHARTTDNGQRTTKDARTTESGQRKDLRFFNGTGGFTSDGREYVIALGSDQWTPAPWVNVVANPDFGFFVSDSGSGCAWAGNSRENRLTPWSNDPVADPPGEVIYLRDEESGEIWTPTPLPIREAGPYVCRHGQGYSVFEHSSRGIDTELTLFVPPSDPVKISRLKIRNDSSSRRALSVTYYAEWVMGVDRIATAPALVTEVDRDTGAMFARNPANKDFPGAEAFADVGAEGHAHTADRLEFLGRYGNHSDPAALRAKDLSGRVGAGLDPCAAMQSRIELAPGETRQLVFLLGQAASRHEGVALIRKYRQPGAAARAQQKAVDRWDGILGQIQVQTPDAALDLLLNRWLLYQVLSGRFWGRTAFYQASGAFGFRDQLQDVMSVMVSAPAIAREHIVRCASRQFVEGDVQHWWHPPLGKGVRTRCSDDRLWLPFAVAQYLEFTGDESVLDEKAAFLTAPPVPQGHAEVFQQPEVAAVSATVDDHCRRAIAVSLEVGSHGLPLIGSCDWNDGFNRVGQQGRGESVWLGWFQHATLMRYAPIVERRGDAQLARQYREHAERLRASIEKQSWDGAWYRRAYYDDGTPLGSAPNEECRIDAIAQSWGVLSGAADPARAKQAMASVDEHLVRRRDGLVLLLAPPFDRGPKDPGYIKGYLPGIRENGGQYTHAAVWTPMAFAALGDCERTAELLAMLNPINHTSTPDAIRKYKTEPYVLAGDVYSQHPHAGRGGWTWYTGSAGWMFRATLESLLGFRVRPDHFVVQPCVPGAWSSYEIQFRDGDTTYSVKVQRAAGVPTEIDGRPCSDGKVPRLRDGKMHQVRIRI